MPTSAERTATLIRGIEASLTGDSTVIEALYTDDVEAWSPAMNVSSSAELAVEFEDRGAFSDLDLDVAPLDVAGERACAEWTAHLTYAGASFVADETFTMPTGLRLTLHGVTVAEFEGDRIRSFRQYWDEAELLAQPGLLPVD